MQNSVENPAAFTEQDPVLSQLCTFIWDSWPSEVPEELHVVSQVIVHGLYTNAGMYFGYGA